MANIAALDAHRRLLNNVEPAQAARHGQHAAHGLPVPGGAQCPRARVLRARHDVGHVTVREGAEGGEGCVGRLALVQPLQASLEGGHRVAVVREALVHRRCQSLLEDGGSNPWLGGEVVEAVALGPPSASRLAERRRHQGRFGTGGMARLVWELLLGGYGVAPLAVLARLPGQTQQKSPIVTIVAVFVGQGLVRPGRLSDGIGPQDSLEGIRPSV
mmetsp:Transcript_30588/g.65019  ORF Transcript_30588/g.65019 Transcript_30588/m.65019 type:complete len:215 (+) Transcript_30588:452-1096(+)